MRKNLYEIFDEFENAQTKEQKRKVLTDNASSVLIDVLKCAFHPDAKWKVKNKPQRYKIPDTLPGMSFSSLQTEMRKFYLFLDGNETAERLTEKKREELLLVMLESLEPREADVVMNIFKKDLNIKGLTQLLVV
jgi:hypothetical protein